MSYDISASPSFIQITNMLDKAFSKYDNLEGLIMHSDQGWQYQMQNYKKKLNDKRIRQSMSRKGNCLDNSPIENFFGKMKNEMFYGYEYTFKTFNQLKWKHALIVIWCLMFIISLIKIINQNANTWWLPWMWGVVSLINVFVLFREIKKLKQIIYAFLTIFLYLLKCPQSLILSALRAFCFCGKPHISGSIFLYFRYQAWLKSW